MKAITGYGLDLNLQKMRCLAKQDTAKPFIPQVLPEIQVRQRTGDLQSQLVRFR